MTLIRLYCRGCDADIVDRPDELEASAWAVLSLHSHAGECPDCRAGVVAEEAPETPGPDATLNAFATDGGEPR